MAVLAAAISIDFDYFSQHSQHGAGGMMPFFLPIPMPSPPYPPEDSGGAGAGGVEGDGAGAQRAACCRLTMCSQLKLLFAWCACLCAPAVTKVSWT